MVEVTKCPFTLECRTPLLDCDFRYVVIVVVVAIIVDFDNLVIDLSSHLSLLHMSK